MVIGHHAEADIDLSCVSRAANYQAHASSRRESQRTPAGRNWMLMRGPSTRERLGTECSHVRWQLPPITKRSPLPTSKWREGPPPRGRKRKLRGAPNETIATNVSTVLPRPMVSPCHATLSLPSRYRQSPTVRNGSPSSGQYPSLSALSHCASSVGSGSGCSRRRRRPASGRRAHGRTSVAVRLSTEPPPPDGRKARRTPRPSCGEARPMPPRPGIVRSCPGVTRASSDRGSAIQQRGLVERLHAPSLAEYEHTFVRLGAPCGPGPPSLRGPVRRGRPAALGRRAMNYKGRRWFTPRSTLRS